MGKNLGFGELKLVRTGDGSESLFVPSLNEHYHSSFGAIQESRYIFIERGFDHLVETNGFRGCPVLQVLEVGFGTGLNALLTQTAAERRGIRVHYTAIEPFPLEAATWQQLNYPRIMGSADYSSLFAKLHQAGWNRPEEISEHFILEKIKTGLQEFIPGNGRYHLVYFDAFGPDVQPELWTAELFGRLHEGLAPGGILVTYSVKGTVVRALKKAGFAVEKLAGPPGKRHILRALKAGQGMSSTV
jgi:tRNA U34 5-methylaminomethyl-2-thiouridine-forming methyltransferase MnmC